MSLFCVCVVCTYLRIVPVVCFCVCSFVNFSVLFYYFYVLSIVLYYKHCVRNCMFVC